MFLPKITLNSKLTYLVIKKITIFKVLKLLKQGMKH